MNQSGMLKTELTKRTDSILHNFMILPELWERD